MTRKRFIKLCMSKGMSRNRARDLARFWLGIYETYDSLYFWCGPDSTSRRKLERIVTGVLDDFSGGLFSYISEHLGPMSYVSML